VTKYVYLWKKGVKGLLHLDLIKDI